MNFIPLGIATDHVTGRSWNFYITETELADREKERIRMAYRHAREDGESQEFEQIRQKELKTLKMPLSDVERAIKDYAKKKRRV